MAKRKGIRAHYEAVFEKLLRDSEIPYIAINEFKRPIISGKLVKIFGKDFQSTIVIHI